MSEKGRKVETKNLTKPYEPTPHERAVAKAYFARKEKSVPLPRMKVSMKGDVEGRRGNNLTGSSGFKHPQNGKDARKELVGHRGCIGDRRRSLAYAARSVPAGSCSRPKGARGESDPRNGARTRLSPSRVANPAFPPARQAAAIGNSEKTIAARRRHCRENIRSAAPHPFGKRPERHFIGVLRTDGDIRPDNAIFEKNGFDGGL